jgi:3-deoxy-manno-octulosonate cytidylyltransferase (CMP-KDO synthetase)
LVQAYDQNPQLSVVTPVHRLCWAALDALRMNKQTTPFSGTTAIVAAGGRAVWFSKNIIPAIRKEDRSAEFSPVYQHMGLYGYAYSALEAFCSWPESSYEQLEGLEQLRFLENNVPVQTVRITVDHIHSGIDSPEDIARAEAFLAQQG